MSIRLGYFPQFKGTDTVLLSCETAEVGALRASLSKAMSCGLVTALHGLAEVSVRHPARLWVCPSPATSRPAHGDFSWFLDQTQYLEVDSKLEALESVRTGHQYFELSQPQVRLMVSVGEYSDQWWQQTLS
jgi:hypothetical protein